MNEKSKMDKIREYTTESRPAQLFLALVVWLGSGTAVSSHTARCSFFLKRKLFTHSLFRRLSKYSKPRTDACSIANARVVTLQLQLQLHLQLHFAV